MVVLYCIHPRSCHASRDRCTSLVCTSGCTSGQGFPIISFDNRADFGRICEICTQKRRSENDFLYKSDLYDYHFGMELLVQVHRRDPYKRKRPEMHVQVQALDLYTQPIHRPVQAPDPRGWEPEVLKRGYTQRVTNYLVPNPSAGKEIGNRFVYKYLKQSGLQSIGCPTYCVSLTYKSGNLFQDKPPRSPPSRPPDRHFRPPDNKKKEGDQSVN